MRDDKPLLRYTSSKLRVVYTKGAAERITISGYGAFGGEASRFSVKFSFEPLKTQGLVMGGGKAAPFPWTGMACVLLVEASP